MIAKVRWAAALGGAMVTVCAIAVAGGSTTLHTIESEPVAGNMMGITSLRPLFVYTPEGYEGSRRRYHVIYWIPGWKIPATSEYVSALDASIGGGWIPPFIAVTIDVREGVLMLNSPVFGNWADFLTQEVVPFIDGEYRTIPSPSGRALMGHSTGGYAAMLLPLLYPGIWSAVGLNDASVWPACPWMEQMKVIDEFSEYTSLSSYAQACTQVATAPNMESPRFFDFPVPDAAGTKARAAWESRCLSNVDMLRAPLDALEQISVIGIVLPNARLGTNRKHNLLMTTAMRQVRVVLQLVNVRGTHGSHRPERFLILAGIVTSVMKGPSLDTWESQTVAWGALKDAR